MGRREWGRDIRVDGVVDTVMSLRFDGRCSSECDLLRRLRGSCVGLAGVALTAVGVCWLGEVGGVDVCCAVRAGAMLSAKGGCWDDSSEELWGGGGVWGMSGAVGVEGG